uniref:Putative LAGLIDADG homing endonuclease n=1 Tax=Pseudococcomyxa simplex TaxID=464287 RepID=A0A1P8NRQ5_9CHLO|nr:putative LAGLIDADG homing endonuclease [Pseudococcomyxa simplex]
MDLDFLAGLIDADGSLLLSLDKCSENRLGYRPKLVLDITNTDTSLLDMVQERLGFGRVVKTSATTFAYRANTHRDARKIVELFADRFSGSAKAEIKLWRHAVSLVTRVATPQVLSDFVHLMYGINTKGKQRRRGIEEWLDELECEYQPDYIQTVESLYLSSPLIDVNGQYISGYCQGDGSFNLANKKRYQPNFTLTDADRDVLDLIAGYFNLGDKSVFGVDPKTSEKNKICYRLQVTRFELCRKVIVPHFDRFPLYGRQQERYRLWREAVLLQESKLNCTRVEYRQKVEYIRKRFKDLKEV